MKYNKLKLPVIIGISVAILGGVGIVGALNGWFGGGGSIPTDTMSRGLVGYWPMDEGTGQYTYDGSGNSNNGTLGAATSTGTDDPAWSTQGKVGGALSFDGSNDFVNVADSTTVRNFYRSSFTVELWARKTALPVDTAETFLGTDSVWRVNLYNTTCRLRGLVSGVNTDLATITWTQDLLWHHWVFEWNGSGYSMYRDGALVLANNGETRIFDASTQTVSIGAYAGSQSVNGLIDEVRVYNRALSAEEIRYHYNHGGPVGYWKFDEGEGQTVFDSTENNNDGTLGSTTAADAADPIWIQGKYGSALSFDGVNDYVNLGTPSTISFTTEDFTVEYWFYTNTLVGYQTPVGRAVESANGWDIEIRDNGNIWFKTYTAGAYQSTEAGAGTIAAKTWYHLSFVRQGSKATIYKNGISIKTGTSHPTSLLPSTNKLLIGAGYAGNQYLMNGLIDDVRIYNYARSASQILQDYNEGFSARL